MDELKTHDLPSLRAATLVAAFAGWPDAAEVASGSARYLARKLRAKRFAEIDPEEFYVFTETRPNTVILAPGQRALEWPSNEFFAWRDPGGARDLVILQGREPNLNWRGYIDIVLELAERCEVSQVVTLGGTYDAVPHRGPVQLSGHATTPELRRLFDRLGISQSSYEGPSSVQSALLEACQRRGLAAASLWGHAPHYVRAVPNLKVSHAVLKTLRAWLELEVDLAELHEAGRQLEARVDDAIAENPELQEYVRELGVSLDQPAEPLPAEGALDLPMKRPDPAELLRELDELLRRRHDEPKEPI
ncbi:MAG TPA: PAC2 family protein [Chloroflexota bacterium]|nr:PAC2 family protein [Chloroflexota bacterium]